MPRNLVVITGASSGIGATFARRLAQDQDLLLIARRKDRLETLRAEFTNASAANVEILPADLTAEADLEMVAQRIENESRLGLLINNAGFGSKGKFWEVPLHIHEEMHKLHVMAVTRLTHAALRNMVQRDFGAIINVASVAAFLRSPGSASYCATKTWMTAFTETLYLELKGVGSNIAVQALCPGFYVFRVSRQNGNRTGEACAKKLLVILERDRGRFAHRTEKTKTLRHSQLALPHTRGSRWQTAH